SNIVLTRPMDDFHVDLLRQAFEKYHDFNIWSGYSVLDQVPELLKRNIMSSRGEQKLGIVLFSNLPDQTHFVFRDLQQNFRLINMNGHTTLMEEHLDTLLDRFHQTLQH
ncbi:MAG: hypothetical protein JKY04_03215, partial [Sneathiella sp.]|nr:hypothetical protein [Sneathiella sp.]